MQRQCEFSKIQNFISINVKFLASCDLILEVINNDIKRKDNFVEATLSYINSKSNSLNKLNEIFTDKQTQYTKIQIIKSIEQYESDDEHNKRMKIKLLECLSSYDGETFTLKEYISFIEQTFINKHKKERETDANSGKGESRKSSLIKITNNSESEDSFVVYSEEKLANKFDRVDCGMSAL